MRPASREGHEEFRDLYLRCCAEFGKLNVKVASRTVSKPTRYPPVRLWGGDIKPLSDVSDLLTKNPSWAVNAILVNPDLIENAMDLVARIQPALNLRH